MIDDLIHAPIEQARDCAYEHAKLQVEEVLW